MQALFGFSGRIGRLEFFAFWMMQGVVVLVGIILSVFIGLPLLKERNLLGLLPMVITIALAIWIWLAITAKRMADIGIPKGVRRYLYLAWFIVSGLIGATLGAQYLWVKILMGQAPYLFLLFWPGQRGGVDLTPGAGGYVPPKPAANWADQIDFSKPDAAFPVAATPQSSPHARRGPAPAQTAYAGGPNASRPTFGRRGP